MLGFVRPHQPRQSDYVNWARGLNDLRQVSSEAAQVRGVSLYTMTHSLTLSLQSPHPPQLITAVSVFTHTSERSLLRPIWGFCYSLRALRTTKSHYFQKEEGCEALSINSTKLNYTHIKEISSC